jgi:hypothetical protein
LRNHWGEAKRKLFEAALEKTTLPKNAKDRSVFVNVTRPESPLPFYGIPSSGLYVAFDLTNDEFAQSAEWNYPGTQGSTPPKTLHDFQQFWDSLRPPGLSLKVPDLNRPGNCRATVMYRHAAAFGSPQDAFVAAPCRLFETLDTFPNKIHQAKITFDDPRESKGSVDLSGTVRMTRGDVPALPRRYLAADVAAVVPYTVAKILIVQDDLKKKFYNDWKTGPFDDAFHALAAHSSDLQYIDLDELPKRIYDLEERSQQNFEAFEFKIPKSDFIKWGIFVLLAVQLCFVLDLHELMTRIGQGTPNLDVAWIGVYRSSLSFGVTVVSGCILPAIAAGMICKLARQFEKPIVIVACLLSFGIAGFTFERLVRFQSAIES